MASVSKGVARRGGDDKPISAVAPMTAFLQSRTPSEVNSNFLRPDAQRTSEGW